MLVAAVLARKSAVHRFSRLAVTSPYITTKPEPIPTRLIRTCSKVKVDVFIPRIIVHLRADAALYAREVNYG
jgi:hypothetical protein